MNIRFKRRMCKDIITECLVNVDNIKYAKQLRRVSDGFSTLIIIDNYELFCEDSVFSSLKDISRIFESIIDVNDCEYLINSTHVSFTENSENTLYTYWFKDHHTISIKIR